MTKLLRDKDIERMHADCKMRSEAATQAGRDYARDVAALLAERAQLVAIAKAAIFLDDDDGRSLKTAIDAWLNGSVCEAPVVCDHPGYGAKITKVE